MKKVFIISLCLLPLLSKAQPVMTYDTHGLIPGTINTMQQTTYFAPGTGGAQLLWDFSEAMPTGASETNETLSQTDGQHVMVTTASGGKFTYTCNHQANIFEGYQDAHQTLIYDMPIKKVIYPFTYGDKLSGNFSARTLYPNSTLEHRMAGSYSSEADAYGTLVMPGGQVLKNVLRLKTIEKYVEERCSTAEVEMVKYLWYIEESRYPVFVTWDITYSYEDGRKTSSQASFYTMAELPQAQDQPVYESPVTTTAGETENYQITHSVFPNPYSDYFHLTYTLEKPTTVSIALYSLAGQLMNEIVHSQVQEAGVQHLTYTPRYSELTGTYYLRLQFDDKVYVRALLKH